MSPIYLAIPFMLGFSISTVNADVLPFKVTQEGLHPTEHLPGGESTVKHRSNRHSFSHAAGDMAFEEKLEFTVGKAIFEKIWVFSPASTTASDGLGPLYNARSCVRCHKNNGRGKPVQEQSDGSYRADVGLLFRLSLPHDKEDQNTIDKMGVLPEPTYGQQLQTFAWVGGNAEAKVSISYQEKVITLADGEQVTLKKPRYEFSDFGYGPLHPEALISPRLTPPVIGLGLLEKINTTAILSLQDPDDLNADGISGRANWVWDKASEAKVLGRFGWKAGAPTLEQQNAAALSGDLGIGSKLFPSAYGDCTQQQISCLQQPDGNSAQQDGLEASHKMTDMLLLYVRNLAVPARSQKDTSRVLAGKKLFHDLDCAKCHRPAFRLTGEPDKIIWPYTDMLLHDMGPDLADGRPEFSADGSEWRTPPLWGIGLTEKVNGHNFYLHDGRASSLLEAILWHGGEAEKSKQKVMALSKQERNNLIKFLESL